LGGGQSWPAMTGKEGLEKLDEQADRAPVGARRREHRERPEPKATAIRSLKELAFIGLQHP